MTGVDTLRPAEPDLLQAVLHKAAVCLDLYAVEAAAAAGEIVAVGCRVVGNRRADVAVEPLDGVGGAPLTGLSESSILVCDSYPFSPSSVPTSTNFSVASAPAQ